MLIPKPYYQNSTVNEILAGITTSLLVIPEALFFSFLAGVDPLIGLSSYLVVGLITALFGGKPGLVSGPEKVSAILLATIIAEHGTSYLLPASVFIGLLQYLTGHFKLGKFIRLIPKSALLGFINGVAISIIITQLRFFKKNNFGSADWQPGIEVIQGLFLLALVGAIIYYGSNFRRYIPPSLSAIIIGSLIAYFGGFSLDTLGDYLERVEVSYLDFHAPFTYLTTGYKFNLITFLTLTPTLVFIAFITIVNSLVSLSFLDEITEGTGNANKESKALGIASMVSGICGFLPGSCMLGQSILNVRVGGQQRLSTIVSIASMVILVTLFRPLLLNVPIVVLFAVMLTMVIGTFSWTSIKHIKETPPTDAFILISVSCFTIISNVGLAIFFGVIASTLVFAWENAKRIRVRKKKNASGKKVYEVYGPLFFASSELFLEKFKIENMPKEVEISFRECKIWDQTGLEALYILCEKCSDAGISVTLSYLSNDTKGLIRKTNIPSNIEIVSSEKDPTYKVVIERTE